MIATEDVDVTYDGQRVRGAAAWPAAGGPHPGLVLIPDVHGLSAHYRDVAQRFARAGFFTFAIDLYTREGQPQLADMDAVNRWIANLSDVQVLGDLGAAIGWVGERPDVRNVGITGFCVGGQYALMAACTLADLGACVSWYGMLRYAETNAKKPRSPLDLAADLTCPYLGLFGAEDALIPSADVDELRERLTNAEKSFEIVSYPGAGHAFHNDTRAAAYRPEAARDGFGRAVDFLHRHLG